MNREQKQHPSLGDLEQAREAASENERRYRELVEHANSAIIRIDTEFIIQFVNEYALNYFGYTAEDLVGQHFLEMLVPESDLNGADQHEACRRAAQSPEIYGSYDQQNCCKDGRWVWMHWSMRAIRDPRGLVRELLCVGVDITKRKDAEFRAESYRRRARRLADQLIASEERERALLAAYLHDNIIQNLSLANIRMGEALDDLGNAASESLANRLFSVRSLLSDAIVECRSVMDRLAPALLDELGLGAALKHLIEKQPRQKATEIEIDDRLGNRSLTPDLAALLFRSARELLINALKYAGPGRISIALWQDGDTIVVSVEDNGVGFDPEELEDSHYDDQGGFGLFAIRERLEGLGGTVAIDSVVGRGTVACIRVPYSSNGESGTLPE